MNRKEAANLLPIIQAFAEGKNIEYRSKGFNEDWKKVTEIPELSFESFEYRIKPEPKFRPFKDAEECWQEMLRHQPFGWLFIEDNIPRNILAINNRSIVLASFVKGYLIQSFKDAIHVYTFADGTPFGVKIEEN